MLIDANILLRTLLPSDNPARAVTIILQAALAGSFTLLLPPDLITEVREKARTKPYLKERIPLERVTGFISLLETNGEPLPIIFGPFPLRCRDPKDNYLLAYAEAGHADFLVTGDDDLLDMVDTPFHFDIVSPAAFLSILRARGLLRDT